jgi:prepilin-type N-terminal cleavage/methylation domain-containing protein
MKKGFTLLEILLVIAAIGVLAAIVIVAINPQRQLEQVTEAETISGAEAIHSALEQYLIDNGSYPAGVSGNYQDICAPGGGSDCVDLEGALVPTYLSDIPVNSEATAGLSGFWIGLNPDNNKASVRSAATEEIGVNVFDTIAITTDGLLMYLDAAIPESYDGTGSFWTDLTDNGYDASIFGTNRWTSTDGGKFDFPNSNNSSDVIFLDADAAQATGASFTLEFWLQPHSSGTRYFSSMSNGSNHNYKIMQQNSTSLQKYTSTGIVDYTDREYLQLVLVRDNSSTGRLYKNGQFVTNVSSTGFINGVADGGWVLNQEQDSLGGGFASDQNYRGAIMAVMLYDRALTQPEIEFNFDALAPRYGL